MSANAARLRDHARQGYTDRMPDTAQIYRPGAPVRSNDFGSTSTYTLLDIVPANYWALSGSEALVLQRMDVKGEVTVVVPALTDITPKDEIVYTVAETGEVHHFLPSFVFQGSGRLTKRVSCVEYMFDTQHNE